MREILFRGKRLDNGEWVEGFIVASRENTYPDGFEMITVDGINYDEIDNYIPDFISYAVDPFTVGQYTGLEDKNGKRVFEGDVIKPFDDEIDKMVVEFHHGQFLLCLYGNRGYMAEYGWEEEGNYGCFEAEPLSSYGDDIEIISTIYDNPEMLKG